MKKAQQELAITDFFNFANENFTSFPFQQWLSWIIRRSSLFRLQSE